MSGVFGKHNNFAKGDYVKWINKYSGHNVGEVGMVVSTNRNWVRVKWANGAKQDTWNTNVCKIGPEDMI